MKRLLCPFLVICLFSCSPKVRNVSTAHYPRLSDTAFVLVLEENDRFYNNNKAGSLNSGETPALCTYDAIITKMKQEARARGANIIKITDHIPPNRQHNCDRISARLYRVDNPKLYERKFEWSTDRKLSWDDYKGNPSSIREPNVGARTSCRFGIRVDTIRTAGKARVLVTNEFICGQSSVRTEQKTPSLLAHEQLHFDLCEVYARRLRQALADAQLTPDNVTTVSKNAFLETYQIYREQQALYDLETNHGLNPDAQQAWAQKIAGALRSLDAWAP